MYLFHFGGTPLPSLYSKTRTSTIVPDVRLANAALQSEICGTSRASLMEHSKSTLPKNDARSSSIDSVISNLFVLHADNRVALSGTTRMIPDRVTVNESLGLLVGTSKK
jgi:hypothetical protein